MAYPRIYTGGTEANHEKHLIKIISFSGHFLNKRRDANADLAFFVEMSYCNSGRKKHETEKKQGFKIGQEKQKVVEKRRKEEYREK